MNSDFIYNLLPAHYRYSDDSKSYKLTCNAYQDQWTQLQLLIHRLTDSRSPLRCDDSVLDSIAKSLGIPNYYSIPPENRRLAVASWSHVVRCKGTARSLRQYAGFLGYEIGVTPLYCSFGYPNLEMVPDASNNYQELPQSQSIGFGYKLGTIVSAYEGLSGYPVHQSGELEGKYSLPFFSYVDRNKTWNLNAVYTGGVTVILSNKNSNQILPQPGQWIQIAGYPVESEVIVTDVVNEGETIQLTMSDSLPNPLPIDTLLCIHNPSVVYASSHYDVDIVIPLSHQINPELENSYFTKACIDIKKLASVAPIHAQIRTIRRSYLNESQTGFIWKDISLYKNHAYRDTLPFPKLINSNHQVQFSLDSDGEGPYLMCDESTLNNINFKYRSFYILFKTSNDITSRQVLYTQGDSTNGCNLYISGSSLYAGVWGDLIQLNWFGSVPINPETEYYAGLVINGERGYLELLLSGISVARYDPIKSNFTFPAHHGEITLFGVRGSTRFHDGSYSIESSPEEPGSPGESGWSGFSGSPEEPGSPGESGTSGFSGVGEPFTLSNEEFIETDDPDYNLYAGLAVCADQGYSEQFQVLDSTGYRYQGPLGGSSDTAGASIQVVVAMKLVPKASEPWTSRLVTVQCSGFTDPISLYVDSFSVSYFIFKNPIQLTFEDTELIRAAIHDNGTPFVKSELKTILVDGFVTASGSITPVIKNCPLNHPELRYDHCRAYHRWGTVIDSSTYGLWSGTASLVDIDPELH